MKHQNQLILSVDTKSWGVVAQEHGSLLEPTSQEILQLYAQIMKRDNYSCYYCGFQSDRFQEVHHIDHDHTNNDPSNLVTVCPLCHQSHHLSLADLHNGAELIYCSNLTQQEINDFCRMVFILKQKSEENSIDKNTHYLIRSAFSTIYIDILEKGKQDLEQMFEGASNCGTMGQVLLDIKAKKPKEYLERDKWLSNIKMLHKPMRYHVQVDYWKRAMEASPNFRIDKWIDFTHESAKHVEDKYEKPSADIVKKAFELDISKILS